MMVIYTTRRQLHRLSRMKKKKNAKKKHALGQSDGHRQQREKRERERETRCGWMDKSFFFFCLVLLCHTVLRSAIFSYPCALHREAQHAASVHTEETW